MPSLNSGLLSCYSPSMGCELGFVLLATASDESLPINTGNGLIIVFLCSRPLSHAVLALLSRADPAALCWSVLRDTQPHGQPSLLPQRLHEPRARSGLATKMLGTWHQPPALRNNWAARSLFPRAGTRGTSVLVTLETKVPVSFKIRLVWCAQAPGSWVDVGRRKGVSARGRGGERGWLGSSTELAEEDVQVVAQAS